MRDVKFNIWMAEVNGLCSAEMMLDIEDFPDWCWMDAFEDGLSPAEAYANFKEEVLEDF